jgi:hypothetical protein
MKTLFTAETQGHGEKPGTNVFVSGHRFRDAETAVLNAPAGAVLMAAPKGLFEIASFGTPEGVP